MKPILDFTTIAARVGERGRESGLPDLLGNQNIQNKMNYFLEEEDEIYEGYGKLSTAFPYRPYNCYARTVKPKQIQAAILENDFLQAVFLPEYGGRLWALVDKTTGENLLYTNDVIRPSNLAIRNAWFSGGVEWNISMIGHSPLTCEPMFTALLAGDDGCPVLRMYEYERVRGVEYQMDFWLGEQDKFLNCRMRIVNNNSFVTPMYWWSNMAVPEYPNGRVAVPATSAFTSDISSVRRVQIPLVNDVDISHYESIPDQVDYFFDIPEGQNKYIANLNQQGYGLLHRSTGRLRSRKLFSWGNNDASDRWQEFLTDKAGRYVEIQAGLGKTQYGCLPMAPHTAWEWLEQYGPITIGAEAAAAPFETLCAQVDAVVAGQGDMAPRLTATKAMAKTPGNLVYKGSGYGALATLTRKAAGERPLSAHLDFGVCQKRQQVWADFLATGILKPPAVGQPPEDFTMDMVFYQLLREAAGDKARDNWYVRYQLGVMELWQDTQEAKKQLTESRKMQDTPWVRHALAVLVLGEGNHGLAKKHILDGLDQMENELYYLKEAFRILALAGGYTEIIRCYHLLSVELQEDSRLKFCYINAQYRSGNTKEAYNLLNTAGLEIADLREGEDSLGELWSELHQSMFGQQEKVPHWYNFNSL